MKQVIGWSIALSVALVGSYLTWTDDSEPPALEAVPVYRATASELQAITWVAENAEVTLTRKSDALGDYIWIASSETRTVDVPVEPEPSEESSDEAPPAPRVEQVEQLVAVDFTGNGEAMALWETYAPLEALRELTELPGLDRSLFGLDAPEGTVKVTKGGQTFELVIGAETYGAKDRYAAMGDRVFLIDDGALRPLQFASSRLVERNMWPLTKPEMETAAARLPDGEWVAFTHENRDDETQQHWAFADTDGERSDEADAFLDRLQLMRFRRYLTDDEVGGPLTPIFAYRFSGKGQTYDIEMLEGPDETYYARSAFNRSLVQMSDAQARDVRKLLEAIVAGR